MKKLIVLAMIMAVMLLVATLIHAEGPVVDLKPTFISPTPGLYVNGWPAFTVSYPKEWVEMPPPPNAVLQVGVSRPDLPPSPRLNILVYVSAFPLAPIFAYSVWRIVFHPLDRFSSATLKSFQSVTALKGFGLQGSVLCCMTVTMPVLFL